MEENWYVVEQQVRDRLNRAWVAVWMDSYLQDALMRERVAESERQAARGHLLRQAAPSRARSRGWALVRRLVQVASVLRPKRGIEGRVLP